MFIIWSIFGLVERIMKKTTSLGSESFAAVAATCASAEHQPVPVVNCTAVAATCVSAEHQPVPVVNFPRISPRRKPPNSRSPRPRDRKLRKFRRSKPLRILSLIQPYLPHFAHVAEEKNLYSSYAYRTHNLSIKTDMVFLDEAHFSRTPQDTLSLFSHSHFHIFPGLRGQASLE